VLRDEAEIEDVMQETYTLAYSRLHQFAGLARFSTWLTRIGLNAALARKERVRAASPDSGPDAPADLDDALPGNERSPEDHAGAQELSRALEAEIDGLPEIYRTIVMLREVHGLDTAEVAEALDITEQTVKTRLHRARAMLRKGMVERARGAPPLEAFLFEQTRCERVRQATMRGLGRGVAWPRC
jgi:RNA polymerase sigma-70 factor, ECF subfamily